KLEKPAILLEEASNVNEYLFIQKTRFPDRVQFEVDIPPDCLTVPIPALTLQPLVENSFIHGIEPMESKGIITIKAEKKGPYIYVYISDNGMGITGDRLEQLRSRAELTPTTQKRDT